MTAPSRVQSVSSGAKFNTTGFGTSFTTLPTQGNAVVVLIQARFEDVSSVSDNQGNTYNKIVAVNDGNNWSSVDIWWANAIGAPSGTFTVTVDFNSSINAVNVTLLELAPPSGQVISLDQNGTNNSGTAAVTSFTVSASAQNASADDLVVAAIAQQYVSGGNGLSDPPASGYTSLAYIDDNPEIDAGYKTTSAIETSSGSWTSSTAALCSAAIATFKSVGSGGSLTITTTSLPNATVGSAYSAQLQATGGSGSYFWDIESAAPNTGKWATLPVNYIVGTPQMAETSSITIRCRDTSGNSATTALTLTSTASSSLAIVSSTTLPNAINHSYYSHQLIASGGSPPYSWTVYQSQPWQVTYDGWVEGTPTVTGSVSFGTIMVTDSAGATASFSPSLTVVSTGISIAGIDPVSGLLNLPEAIASQAYSHQLYCYGGTGSGQSWSVTSGSLASGLSLSSGGLITGTPSASGNVSPTIRVADSGSNSASAAVNQNVRAGSAVSRPSYNSSVSNGFFVLNGILYDPDGYEFRLRGVDQLHYDSDSWTGNTNGARSGCNSTRVFMYTLNTAPTTPDAATYASTITANQIDNGILPILTAQLSPDGTTLSGNDDPTELADTVAWWVNNVSAFSSIMGRMAINIANEWGVTPTFGGTVTEADWQSYYETAVSDLRTAGYTCPIVIDTLNQGKGDFLCVSGGYAAAILAADPLRNIIFSFHMYGTDTLVGQITGITKGTDAVITFNSTAALNPFSSLNNNSTTVWVTGVGGMTQINGQTITRTATGGSSGAYTVTTNLDTTSYGTYTSGGQIYDGWQFNVVGQTLAGFIADGICCAVLEFGYYGDADGTQCAQSQFIAAMEAYKVGWNYWAWDDHQNSNPPQWSGYWGCTGALSGTQWGQYSPSVPSQLTVNGMDAILNPRTGQIALPSPAPVFL